MEDLIFRFPFVAQEVFEKLDDKSLTKCREVSRLWKDFIDERNYPWIRIVKIPSVQTGSGNTFLHLSAKTGQIEMFETIFSDLDEQSDKNPPNDTGLTPFHLSCAYGHIKIVEIFVKNSVILNIDLNSVTYTCGWTGFHCACQNGQLEIAEFLMENSDIFDIDVTGFIFAKPFYGTVFHLACKSRHLGVANFLIENYVALNIDFNSKDEDGHTSFHVACSNGSTDIVELIIKKSIDLNIDLNAKYRTWGWTGFHLACEYGHYDTVKVFLKYSSDSIYSNMINLNAPDEFGYTGFHVACREGFPKIVELIMRSSEALKINLNAKSNSVGYTGFSLACAHTDMYLHSIDTGHYKIVEMLIKNSKALNIDTK